MNVLVTGGGGFVGRALIALLAESGHRVVATSRDGRKRIPGATVRTVGELGPDTDWRQALDGVDTVVHLAARVHVMDETAKDPLTENRRINRDGTAKLAEDAAAAGVRRFVFLSTIKVNGEQTTGQAFDESMAPDPKDPYAVAKFEAEQILSEIFKHSAMEVVIIRPPLVYGPGVGGNFRTLLKICARGWPLPLRAVNNRRNLIYVGNLAHAIALVCQHPMAAGKTWLVGDGEAVSTAMLIDEISKALDRAGMGGPRPRLWPLPPVVLRGLAAMVGKSAAASRLLGDLELDDRAIRRDLGWTPPFSMVQGLSETATGYVAAMKDPD